ncbi:hypothetical protein KKI19_02855 [Patescibacteria group bacterium]|nr:hypothetical protein [Patescibacteria group bacterium]
MTKDLKHYLALIAFLSIGLAFFLVFNYNRQIQTGISLVMAAGYVVWGIVHHTIKKELHPKIILEYVLVAIVASVVVIFLLMRT